MKVSRRRHPNKDIEIVLVDAEAHGWTVTPGPKYWKLFCTCPGKHKKWVHLTPSNPNYVNNLASWLRRQPCW